MDKFSEWWNGSESPRRHLNESTAEQVKWIARDSFNAGNHVRHLRLEKRRATPSDFKLED